MNKETHYQVHDSPKAAVLQVLQKASYTNCEPVRNFFEKKFNAGQRSFIVDFANCTSVDSTFLGILVRLALNLRNSEDSGKLALVNLNGRNLETVKNLGIHRIAEISSHAVESVGDLESLTENGQDDIACSETIYEAHKTLMNLNEKNLRMFCDVVSFLEHENESLK
ncbi:MAG: STAS domain-containing protein [Verrucomicrobiota bacterium]|nr:STAS domain-containing protein [Verrucomicrobiota bacterium]